jgi:predicted metal-dependent hydrolase
MPSPVEHRSFCSGDELISYSLRRTGRRRTVGIFVEPDMRVTVLSPQGADVDDVERILRKRMPWIRRQRRAIEALPPPPAPRQWVNGETHRYLGRQYRLKLIAGRESKVRLLGAYIHVTVPTLSDHGAIRKLVEAWYRQCAHALVPERASRLLRATTWLEISEVPPIVFRALSQRWASTTVKKITFNPDVVKLSSGCLDYVIAHELVHLRIPNHSPAYWRMLGRVMPDWKKWRDRLARAEI